MKDATMAANQDHDDAFLSHNQADNPWLRRLSERLRAVGLARSTGLFGDGRDNPPGRS